MKCGVITAVRLSYVVLLELLDGELGLHQVVVQSDDLSAQSSLLIVMVLRLTTTREELWKSSGGE